MAFTTNLRVVVHQINDCHRSKAVHPNDECSNPPLIGIGNRSLQCPGGPQMPHYGKIALPLHKVQPKLCGTIFRKPRSIERGVKRIVRNTGDDESVVGPQPVIQHQEVLEGIYNRKMENTLQQRFENRAKGVMLDGIKAGDAAME